MCLRQSDLNFIDVPSFVCEDFQFIHMFIYIWPWLDVVEDHFAFVEADFHDVSKSCSNLSASCWSSSLRPSRSMSSANRKLQSGRPPMDIDDSDLLTSSVSYSKLSANWPFSDCRIGIKVFCIIFCKNMLNGTYNNGHVLLLSFERCEGSKEISDTSV